MLFRSTSILTASPITGGPITTTGTIGIIQATTSTDGYLSSTDWNTFNSKFNLPTLTSGSVLFSNGTTIAQDNTNFFWDDTNNRLGIGTNVPLVPLHVVGGDLIVGNALGTLGLRWSQTSNALSITGNKVIEKIASDLYYGSNNDTLQLRTADTARLHITTTGDIGIGTTTPSATSKVNINLGTFSGTKDAIAVDGNCTSNPGNTGVRFSLLNTSGNVTGFIKMVRASGTTYLGMQISSQSRDGIAFLTDTVTATEKMRLTALGNLLLGTTANVASSKLTIDSTTQGFLPPRMTNAQRIAIATPAVGLMVYCTDVVEGLYINKSTGWTLIA